MSFKKSVYSFILDFISEYGSYSDCFVLIVVLSQLVSKFYQTHHIFPKIKNNIKQTAFETKLICSFRNVGQKII